MQEKSLNVFSDGKVVLNLPAAKYNKRRFIGRINYEQKTFFSVRRNRKVHVFRKNNSLSVPYDLIHKKKKGFLYICINLDGKRLWTSALAFIKLGIIMSFVKQGFETQVFLELEKFKKTKREARIQRNMLKKGGKI
jgi:hypothetical protein